MKKSSYYWWAIINIILTIYLGMNFGFKDVLFFWIISGIAFSLTYYMRSFYLLFRYIIRIMLVMSGKDYGDVVKAAKKINEIDSNQLDVNEYNSVYERLGEITESRIWKKKISGVAVVKDISMRNIISRFLGIDDPVVRDYISKVRNKKGFKKPLD